MSWLLLGGYGFFDQGDGGVYVGFIFEANDTGIFSADDQGHEEGHVDARFGNGICDFVSEGRLVVAFDEQCWDG